MTTTHATTQQQITTSGTFRLDGHPHRWVITPAGIDLYRRGDKIVTYADTDAVETYLTSHPDTIAAMAHLAVTVREHEDSLRHEWS